MSAVEKLEALINLEQNLKSGYDKKLEAQEEQLKAYAETQATLQTTVKKQAEQIAVFSSQPSASKRLEQENRELGNRANKLQNELDSQRAKLKTAQKELVEAKSTIKTLKHLDAEKLKKNLVATKNKLGDERTANDLISKKLNTTRQENNELHQTIEKLTSELEALKDEELKEDAQKTDVAEEETSLEAVEAIKAEDVQAEEVQAEETDSNKAVASA